MNNENLDDTANKGTEQAKKAGSSIGKKVFSLGKKAITFLMRKLMVMLGLSMPVVLGFLVLVAIIGTSFYFGQESRGTDQEFEFTSAETENMYTDVINEYGDPELVGLSEENAFLQIFYQNEVDKSYWKYYLDKNGDTVLDFGNNSEPFNEEVVDKYGREKYFQLNAMSLYALDEHLNKNNASTPQTFIQHVPFKELLDNNGEVIGLDGVELTNDEGELTIKSQSFDIHEDEELFEKNENVHTYRREYDKNGDRKTTEGIWDYGLAPVYHYLDFEEERELRNEITGGETWDVDAQQMRKMTVDELNSFSGSSAAGAVPETDEHSTETVYLIKDAVTPMGTIRNEIEQVWQESGKIVTKTYNVPQSVSVRKTRKVKVDKGRGDANWRDDVTDNRVRPMSNNPTIDTSTGGFPSKDSEKDDGSTDTGAEYIEETYYETEIVDRQIEVKGVEWEYVARYVGEPDTEELDALGYYIDYFGNYDNYVDVRSFTDGPFTYLEKAKLQEELGIELATSRLKGEVFEYDEDELGFKVKEYGIPPSIEERKEGEGAYILDENDKRIKKMEHPLMKSIRELQLKDLATNGTGSPVDLDGVEFASESDGQAVQNASRYLPQFQEYGARYGVDPMLLVAIAAVETEGNHEQTQGFKGYNGVRRSYLYKGNGYNDKAAIGLMQLLPDTKNPAKTKSVTAFNHDTGEMETFKATPEDLHDLENNIKYGAMQLASEMRAAKHDVLVGIMAYHTGISYALYITDENTPYDTWSPESVQGYYEHMGRKKGTNKFVERVLARYLPTAESQFPWVLNHEGERMSPNIENLEMPSGELVNTEVTQSVSRRPSNPNQKINNGVKYLQDIVETPFRAMSTITGWIGDGITKVVKWFNLTEVLDTRDYYRVGTNMKEGASNDLFLTMLSYDEGLHLSDYAELDDEELIELMLEKYMNNLRKQDNIGMNINPSDYFEDGYKSPVDNVDIVVKYGDLKRGHKSQFIQLAVPGSSKIYAVADGTIKEITEHTISIDHGNGVATIYEGVGEILVSNMKVGDEIKKGTVIARGSANENDTIEKDAFAFGLYKNGKYDDPTWIVDSSVLTQGGGNIDPSSTTFQHPYYGRQWRLTSPYSMARRHPNGGQIKPHYGTDYAGFGSDRWTNMDILAPADGIVVDVRYMNGWGNTVVLEHPQMQQADGRKVFTLYAHMVRLSPVQKGMVVKQGQKIGNEGQTGNSRGDHLHIELMIGHGNWAEARAGGKNTFDFHKYVQK